MLYENVWKPERVAACLGLDAAIMKEGLTWKELSEEPEAIERLADCLLSMILKRGYAHVK